jgi:hypothetical protein
VGLGSETLEVVEADESESSEGKTERAKRRDEVPEACSGRFHRSRRAGHVRQGLPRNLGDPVFSVVRRNRVAKQEASDAAEREVGVPQ